MHDEVAARAEAAAEVAVLAGRLAQALRIQGLEVAEKGPQDVVTQADRGAEALIRSTLQQRFPDDGFLGEEGGHVAGGAGTWVVDPVDGTANFAAGLSYWCVSVAWVREGNVEIGAIYAPDLGELYTARFGGGAYLNGRRLPKLPDRPASRSIVSVGRSPKTPARDHGELIGRVLEGGYEYRRFGSGAMNLAQVGAGGLQAFVEVRINSWDVLAGLCIAREAGAWCSDFLADDGLFKPKPVVATLPCLHEDLLNRIGLPHLKEMPGRRPVR